MTLPADIWQRETYFLKEDPARGITQDKPGEFHYVFYESHLHDEPTDRVYWEYRNLAGTLHTGTEVSLPEAIKAAQRWA